LAVAQCQKTGCYFFANLRVTGYLENDFHNQVSGLLWHEPNIGPQEFPMEKFGYLLVNMVKDLIDWELHISDG
jgi:hypothetical protein